MDQVSGAVATTCEPDMEDLPIGSPVRGYEPKTRDVLGAGSNS